MAQHDFEPLYPFIIKGCYDNKSFFLQIKRYLDTSKKGNKNYFTDKKFQEIFNFCGGFFDKYQRLPKRKEIDYLFDKKYESDDTYKLLLKGAVKNIFEIKSEEYELDFIEDQTKEFVKEIKAYEAFVESKMHFESRDYGEMFKVFQEAAKVSFDEDLGVSIKDIKENIKMVKEVAAESAVTTGLSTFDNLIGGGYKDQELTVFGAPPGIGKTLIMGASALAAYKAGKNALVYTFETSKKRLLGRFYSNILQLGTTDIQEQDNASLEADIDGALPDEGDLIIKEYNSNAANTNDLLAHIEKLKLHKNWEPDIIFVDYILIMNVCGKLSSDNSYKYYKTVAEELRNMAKTLNVPVVTAVQLNRGAQDEKGGTKRVTTSKDLSESRGILDTADTFITVNQTVKEKEAGKFRFFLDKFRNGANQKILGVNVSYTTMTLSDA